MTRTIHTTMLMGLCAATLLAVGGCREQPVNPVAQEARIPRIITQTPRQVELRVPVHALGRLESADELQLAFKSAGVIARLHVDIGDSVRPGQLLAELESTELDSAATRASEAVQKAERDAVRATELHSRGLIASELLENAITTRDVAAADLRAARFNRNHAEIRASGSGRVLARHANAHEIVAAGAAVLSVSSSAGGWLLRVQVADRDVLRIDPGVTARLRFDALPGEVLNARVARISAQADPATAAFELELALDQNDTRLRSGMIARAEIATASEGSALVVPLSALVDAGNDEGRLYVAVAGRAHLKNVGIGRLVGDAIAVTSGLDANDHVIVGGAAYVDDDAPVQVVDDEG